VMLNHPVIKKLGGSTTLVIVPRVTTLNVVIVRATAKGRITILQVCDIARRP
jgi:hypothetical protein